MPRIRRCAEPDLPRAHRNRNLARRDGPQGNSLALRLKGFRLAIDDFGIGYSSMMQLRSLPFSELKIDKSFVTDMLHSEDAAIIVDAILALAGAFRMDVVAEGIETEAQLAALVRRGCGCRSGLPDRPTAAAGRDIAATSPPTSPRDRAPS